MQLTIRPAETPQDYPAIAAVLEAENPGWGESAEALAYNDATHDPAHYHATIVAEEGGPPAALIGVAFVGHDGLAYQKHSFQMNLRVHPTWQGKGVGKALYAAVLTVLASKEAQELVTQVWHTHPRAARFLTERGFVESWRRVDWMLDATSFDLMPYRGLAERLQAQGITIKTYADLAANPDRLVNLYELDWRFGSRSPMGRT